MLEFVCFRWKPAIGYRSTYPAGTVNVLKRMLDRHYHGDHRLSCITDDPAGIDSDVRIIPLWGDFADIPSPHGNKNPSCYRRLKLFAPEMRDIIGPRFVSLDLDIVITSDVTKVFNRPEDFVMYGDSTNPRTHYNGSMVMMTAGARRQIWDEFDPYNPDIHRRSQSKAVREGHFGSDQGWISYRLGKGEATWTRRDGVFSYRCHAGKSSQWPNRDKLPEAVKVVIFHGRWDPWNPLIRQIKWVGEAYR